MITIRLFFEKKDRAKYISHLDITRCMQRALKRAKIPLWYTEGFNPHLYMTFALPLALGYESNCESMDVRLLDEEMPLAEVVERCNLCLPRGLKVLSAAEMVNKPDTIAWADYRVYFACKDTDPEELLRQWTAYCAQPEILVEKKTKKGKKELDIRPALTVLDSAAREDGIALTLRLAAGGVLNINPTLVLEDFAQRQGTGLTSWNVLRVGILTAQLEPFA